jgi:hypothetical protein
MSLTKPSNKRGRTGSGGNDIMTNSSTKTNNLIQRYQSIKAHMKFLINSVGRLDLQSCRGMADSMLLKNRIALYRWSLKDFKEAVQRHDELYKRIFPDRLSTEENLKEYRGILEQINSAIVLAENANNNNPMREELNVYLVKINMAVNKICESISLRIAMEDKSARQHQYTK